MLEPLGHRVLIKVVLKKQTDSGLVLVHDERFAKAAMEHGEIIAIGPNAWKAFDGGEPWAKVGDRVLFSKYGGKFVIDPDNPPVDGEDFIIINDEDCLARIS